jgi:sulfite exporter TauE/SafE
MDMSFWDHLFERHSDKLTFAQRTIRHGIVFAFAFALGACLKMLIDALLGNDVNSEQALQFAGIGVAASVVFTAIDLLRGPHPTTKPELHLTDEMRRRIR